MSKLSFQTNFSSGAMNAVGLPVEVRKPNLVVAARGITSEPLELEPLQLVPGTYHVTARLPAGQELYGQVEIVAGADAVVNLTPEPEDESPHEWQAEQHYFIGEPQVARRYAVERGVIPSTEVNKLESLGSNSVAATLRAFGGNPFGEELTPVGVENWYVNAGERSAQIFIEGGNQLRFVQLLQPEMPILNMALPASERVGCSLVIQLEPTGFCSLNANLHHTMADMLLRYSQKGYQQQASVTSHAIDAERLLYSKAADPIAAAVGAYALLRFGELDLLHDWTENLRNWFTWLPDGAAIRGEHLAREGKHQEALTAFLDLQPRGLPVFSDGLSYAVDRLRLYVSLGEKHFSSDDTKKAQSLLETLQRFAAFTDFRKPITTFTGTTPDKPSDDILPERFDLDGGLDVGQHLG